MKKLSFLLFFIFLFLSHTSTLAASFNFQPSSFELTANAGDEIVNVIRIENSSAEDIYLLPQVEDLQPDKAYSLVVWTFLDQQQIKIASHSGTNFKFNLKVSPSARPGGYFGAVVFWKKYADPNLQLADVKYSII
ncbi:MAG: hypothetical protein ACOX50_00035 [Patescibacteria group bacterium]|jgi:hypothetical protein